MGRPPLPLGTHGRVRLYRTDRGYRARTLVRDYDGKTRAIERSGSSKARAEAALKIAVRDRSRMDAAAEISADTSVAVLAEKWFLGLEELAPTTRQAYRDRLDLQVLPSLGNLRVRELTVGTVDRHLRAVAQTNGPGVSKMVRSVLSGLCGLAARHDALDRNPVRDAGRIPMKRKKLPRSMTAAEVRQLRALLTYDERALDRDVPDLVDLMLATGLRIGEATALHWEDFDLSAATVDVHRTLVRIKGQGVVVSDTTKTQAGKRLLVLPTWCVTMLARRSRGPGPVFMAQKGGLRDPTNTQADLRDALRTAGFGWATSHTLRKTVATTMDQAGLSARATADQLGHAQPSMTQDVYMGRQAANTGAALALEVFDFARTGGSYG